MASPIEVEAVRRSWARKASTQAETTSSAPISMPTSSIPHGKAVVISQTLEGSEDSRDLSLDRSNNSSVVDVAAMDSRFPTLVAIALKNIPIQGDTQPDACTISTTCYLMRSV